MTALALAAARPLFVPTSQIRECLIVARDEIAEQQEAHPEVKYAVSGAALMLRVSLNTSATMRCDPIIRRHLAAAAQVSGQTLSGAIGRHPELAQRAEKLLDNAIALLQLADLLRVEE